MEDRVGRSKCQSHKSRESDAGDIVNAFYQGSTLLSMLRRKGGNIQFVLIA